MKQSRKNRGVLTIEASIAYSIFLMVIVTFLYLMRVVYTYGLVQHAVSQTAKELSMYTYIYQIAGVNDLNTHIQDSTAGGRESFNQDVEEVVKLYETFSSGDFSGSYEGTTDPVQILKNIGSVLLGEGSQELNKQMFQLIVRPMMEGYIGADSRGNSADERLKALRVIGGMGGFDYSASHFFEDGATVDLVVCYTIDPVFPIDIMPEMNLANRARVRGVNGKNVFTNTGGSGDLTEDAQKDENKKSIWDMDNAVERGKELQRQQGVRNLPDTFPVYAGFEPSTGKATAATSIDLREKSYETASGIKNRLKQQCVKMQDYKTSSRNGVEVKAEDIKQKVLIVYIPSSSGDRIINRKEYDKAVAQLRREYPDINIQTKEID